MQLKLTSWPFVRNSIFINSLSSSWILCKVLHWMVMINYYSKEDKWNTQTNILFQFFSIKLNTKKKNIIGLLVKLFHLKSRKFVHILVFYHMIQFAARFLFRFILFRIIETCVCVCVCFVWLTSYFEYCRKKRRARNEITKWAADSQICSFIHCTCGTTIM